MHDGDVHRGVRTSVYYQHSYTAVTDVATALIY